MSLLSKKNKLKNNSNTPQRNNNNDTKNNTSNETFSSNKTSKQPLKQSNKNSDTTNNNRNNDNDDSNIIDEDNDNKMTDDPPPLEIAAKTEQEQLEIVFPGDKFELLGSHVRLGPGLVISNKHIIASRFGPLIKENMPINPLLTNENKEMKIEKKNEYNSSTSKLWINSNSKRYTPITGDLVLGIIMEKNPENYKVEIGHFELAILSALAFEGATKRNKPNLSIGGLIYCIVENTHKYYETSLTCCSPHFKKEWVTGLSIFGELTGGYSFKCSLKLARKLLEEDNICLALLGKYLPFEIAIGQNGRVWVNSSNPLHVVLISNAIQNSEHLNDTQTVHMIQKLMQTIQ